MDTEGKSRPGCVLIVDDEEILRKVSGETLTRIGYRVLTAADGLEAVKLFSERAEEIDIVILDMIMPRMNGVDCLECLRGIDPNIPVVLCSGYIANAMDAEKRKFTTFLKKPYRAVKLHKIVEETLASCGRERKRS